MRYLLELFSMNLRTTNYNSTIKYPTLVYKHDLNSMFYLLKVTIFLQFDVKYPLKVSFIIFRLSTILPSFLELNLVILMPPCHLNTSQPSRQPT